MKSWLCKDGPLKGKMISPVNVDNPVDGMRIQSWLAAGIANYEFRNGVLWFTGWWTHEEFWTRHGQVPSVSREKPQIRGRADI